MAEQVKGYLIVTVLEASGNNQAGLFTWDSPSWDGFVKGGQQQNSCNV